MSISTSHHPAPRRQTKYKPLALRLDQYRYQGSMALYALPILAVLLLLFCALLVNFQFGTNLTTLMLLVLLILVRPPACEFLQPCVLTLKSSRAAPAKAAATWTDI